MHIQEAICPNCKKPTMRQQEYSTCTLMNFAPIYDESGVNINPDLNITTTFFTCLKCNTRFRVKERGGELIDIKAVDDSSYHSNDMVQMD